MATNEQAAPVAECSQTKTVEVEAAEMAPKGEASEAAFSQFVNSMDDLKAKFPSFYNKILEGLASNMVIQMRRFNERLKKARFR
jgi:hypothetical protein